MAKERRARANLKARGRVHPKFDTRLAPTAEEWRDEKRGQWREVMNALERFRFGSAYTPERDAQYRIWKLSIQVEEAVNAKGWIAWL